MSFNHSQAEFEEGDRITVIDELGSSYTGVVDFDGEDWYLDEEYLFAQKPTDELCIIIPSDTAEVSGFVREIRDIVYLD